MARNPARTHVCLVCRHPQSVERGRELKALGFRVTVVNKSVSGWIGYVRDLAPQAMVFDLDRMPSYGRELGVHMRASKTTRHLPLVYLGGLEAKTARLKSELPDAVYAPWSEARAAIERAVAEPPDRPVRPVPRTERWRDGDLAKRLGLRAGATVVTWGEADFLLEMLGELPDVVVTDRLVAGREAGPVIWLCVARTADEMEAAFGRMTTRPGPKTAGWLIHPKQSSRMHTDFNQNDVRASGLARGWVDSRVCAVDGDWSALRFTKRKAVSL